MTDTTPAMFTDPPPGYADWLTELKTRIHLKMREERELEGL